MSVAGVDPGAGGAFALVDESGGLLFVRDMPTIVVNDRRRVVAAGVLEILQQWKPRLVIIERIFGISKQSASASLMFGYSAGLIEGVCAGMGQPVTMQYPITWKKAMGVTSDKAGCRQAAMRLWPQQHNVFERVCDHGRADAALLAMYQIMQSGSIAA